MEALEDVLRADQRHGHPDARRRRLTGVEEPVDPTRGGARAQERRLGQRVRRSQGIAIVGMVQEGGGRGSQRHTCPDAGTQVGDVGPPPHLRERPVDGLLHQRITLSPAA